jgi:SH3-like domain-containing protein
VFGEYVDVQPRIEIKADDVRLRESPSLDGRIKEQLSRGDVFYKVQSKDGWVQVASSASGLSGWVKADYTVKSTGSVSRPYTISGNDVNFRASPNIDGDVIAKLPEGAKVNVLGRSEKWAYAYYQGHKGWLYTEYLSSVGGPPMAPTTGGMNASPTSRTLSWKQVGGTSIGNRLIERARAMMGTPYVWGGESDDGVDCSGLIYKLLGDEGAQAKCLPRRASEQMAQLGLAVEKEELAPGDLVFFHTDKEGASHVGIYLGDGDFIHASSAQHKVTVSNLSEGYYRERFVGARRLTEEELKSLR